MTNDAHPGPSRYVIAFGESAAEAEENVGRAGDGHVVLVQTVRPAAHGGWIARGEVLLP